MADAHFRAVSSHDTTTATNGSSDQAAGHSEHCTDGPLISIIIESGPTRSYTRV